MPKEKITFSVDSIRRMTCEDGKKRTIYYDKKQPKLACIVSKTGIKTFAMHTFDRTRKKPLQHTLGRYPEISINHARNIAGKLLAQLADGTNIKEAARAIREEPTVDDLFNKWLSHAEAHNRTWEGSDRTYNRHIKATFGNIRISTVTTQQVRTWHTKLLKKDRQRKINGKKVKLSKATANRRLALLRSIFNQQAPELTNPCNTVKAFKETSRDRFLQPDELKVFFDALYDDATPLTLRDMVNLLLLTGARRANLLSMAWKEIDFTSAIWTIPGEKSKNNSTMKIPLVQQAIEILTDRKAKTNSVFVFPGTGKTGHIVEPKRAWRTLLNRAGLSDVKLHDLRRTCGSYQAASGTNQAVISKSLGHKNIATTAIYTRMNLDPVRNSMERAAEAMQTARNSKKKIIDLRGVEE